MNESRKRLTLQPPRSATVSTRMDAVREHCIQLGETLEALLPPGRELSLALTKLEELTFWAIAAVARNQDNVEAGEVL